MSSPLPPTRIRRAGVPRGVAVCTILIATAMCAAGCGAGFSSPSLRVRPDSGSAQLGNLRINGVVVVADPATREAEVVAAIANMGPGSNQLVSVTAGGLPAVVRPATSTSPLAGLPGNNVTLAGNTVTIAGGSAVSFGQPGRPALDISGGSLVPGHFTRVEFGFAGIGQTAVSALIMRDGGLIKSYNLGSGASATSSQAASPGASPSPAPRPRAGSNPSASPSAGTSGNPLPVPSASRTSVAPLVTAPSSAGAAGSVASTTLRRAPHLPGSREPRR